MIYGYARVSTAKQADDGESLEVQQRMMTGYGLIHGIEIGRTFIERGVQSCSMKYTLLCP